MFGGRSGEHEVSLLSAASILKAIDPKKYEVVPVGITKEGRWVTSAGAKALLSGTDGGPWRGFDVPAGRGLTTATAADGIQPTALGESLKVDVIFPRPAWHVW